MHQFQKHFTLGEARTLLPQLREIFAEAHRCREQFTKAEAALGKRLDTAGGDLGGPPVGAVLRELLQLNQQAERVLALGVQMKDFDRGLVDFPHLRDGREVFLCWELGEDDIEFWHDVDAGYGGRERL